MVEEVEDTYYYLHIILSSCTLVHEAEAQQATQKPFGSLIKLMILLFIYKY